eukprot:TRINITY_DN27843_c0_g1_i1.p1 TRINITY_DN27843_c0_g1~~TRINITY_DN27843_c0_g1_i1.p1  ORF type:complete len:354 (+),score=71.76 TRINITY_DN27843_c0_g1_i1:86-1147(+)
MVAFKWFVPLSCTLSKLSSATRVGETKAGFGALLVMSDIDDTITCPTADRSATKDLAGYDICPGMEHNQIYHGYAAFIHVLGLGFDSAEFQIVSANPIPKEFGAIKSYLQQGGEYCTEQMTKAGLPAIPVAPRNDGKWIHKGALPTGGLGMTSNAHKTMGVRKLNQLAKQATGGGFDRIVFMGDTGQGDVCAAVCFVHPEQCTEEMVGPFYAAVQEWGKNSFVDWATGAGYVDGLKFVQTAGAGVETQRFAFLHKVDGVDYDKEPAGAWKKQCLAAAESLPGIGIFERKDGDVRSDYGSFYKKSAFGVAMDVKKMPGLMRQAFPPGTYDALKKVMESDCGMQAEAFSDDEGDE